MEIIQALIKELGITKWQVEKTIDLIDQGNTIPFIARYRKEVTGSLTDEILRKFYERLLYLRQLKEKKEQVITTIEEQGVMTEALREEINKANTLVQVEDLYRPYRPKRRTKATIAREQGLEPLATVLLLQKMKKSLKEIASPYVNKEKGILTVEEAINGAKNIIAEIVADEAEYRGYIRKQTFNQGILISKIKNKAEKTVFDGYDNYEEPIRKLVGHRILAINRGEKEKVLIVKLQVPEERFIEYLEKKIIMIENEEVETILKEAIADGYKRLIEPSIEREIRNELSEKAEEGAIQVFGKNMAQLLMQAPIKDKKVLALDPAFRTGCKVAMIDGYGRVLDTGVIYPTAPHNKIKEAEIKLKKIINKHHPELIAIGNGTASRETESFAANMLKTISEPIHYVIVNEAGASVYSASKLGTEEFPEYDVALRSAISIGRRIQDPLAELVKIDPKSIGVGQYQHDMNQKKLEVSLAGVVEDCVNKVGIDLNTASKSLLQYIAGISKAIAKNIIIYRKENGAFRTRKDLLKVSKLGPKAYKQCAGFLRISEGKQILDNTGVHPESYKVAENLLKKLNISIKDITSKNISLSKKITDIEKEAKELNVGVPTLEDIIQELEKPGRDPRGDISDQILRMDVLDMKDLKEGMILKGTVRNVIDFGAFVDIGVHQDGLVHISQMVKRYIKHPLEVVSVGDIVEVRVLNIDLEKKRIGLTMLLD